MFKFTRADFRAFMQKFPGRLLTFGVFALGIGLFSQWPVYQHVQPNHGEIKFSFALTGQRLAACRERTPEELAALPPNMRAKKDCARERTPVTLQIALDGKNHYDVTSRPGGFAKDGNSLFYGRFPLPAGAHVLKVKLIDSPRTEGYDVVDDVVLEVKAGEITVLRFNTVERRFTAL